MRLCKRRTARIALVAKQVVKMARGLDGRTGSLASSAMGGLSGIERRRRSRHGRLRFLCSRQALRPTHAHPCPFMPALAPLEPLNPALFDAPLILQRLASSGRALAELKLGRSRYYTRVASNVVLQPQPA